jgi:hypothetical protein
MSEHQLGLALNNAEGDQRRGGMGRTLTDMLFILVWVAGYTVILRAFQIIKVLESLSSNVQMASDSPSKERPEKIGG